MLRIVPYPHPALRYESKPVTRIDENLRAKVAEMFDVMYEARGIGLAANQVGLPFRFFILNVTADPEQKDREQVFINPEIVKRHASVEEEEGCLSFPGLYGDVKRARKIRVRAYSLKGEPFEVEADELYSRAIQHELDHLDGKLFIDWLAPSKTVDAKVKEIEAAFRADQAAGLYPDDATLKQRLESPDQT